MKLVFIRVYKDNKLLFVKQYPPSSHILIGSDPEAVLKLDSPKVSTAHALIEEKEGGFFISDLGAEEGVFINGTKSVGSQIKYGDNIQIGEFRLEFFDSVPKPQDISTTDSSNTKTKTPPPPPGAKSAKTPPKPAEAKSKMPPPPPSASESPKFKAKTPSSPPPSPPEKPSLKDRIKDVKDKKLKTPGVENKLPKPPAFQAPLPKASSKSPTSSTSRATSAAGTEDKISLTDIKPHKGPVVEILVAWGNRIIDSKHFTKNVVTIGSNSSNDILLPYVRGANHRIVSKQGGAISVFVPKGCDASVITKTSTLSLNQVETSGGAKPVKDGSDILLKQEEMVKVSLGENISILVRRVPRTIKPMMLPLTGLSVQELTNVVLTVGLSILMAVFFVISDQNESIAKEKEPEDKKERKALFVYKPPPQPETRIKPPPPPPPTTVKIVKVKKLKKIERKKRVKAPKKTRVVKKVAKKGKASDAPKTNSKSQKKILTAKNPGTGKGISRGTSPKKAPIDTQTVGLLGLFAKGGTQKSLKNAVDGSGVSAAAKGATGIGSKRAAGSGTVVGKGLNRVGKSGKGESTFGIAGVKTKGRGSGDSGYGSGGNIGGRGGINIEAGGDEESFEGSMDREAIKRVVQRHLRQLKTCYNRVLDKDPSAEGKVVLNWTILAGGNVGSSKSVSSEINNRAMLRCMTSRLRSWKFPSPPDGQIGDITYPFVFTSAK